MLKIKKMMDCKTLWIKSLWQTLCSPSTWKDFISDEINHFSNFRSNNKINKGSSFNIHTYKRQGPVILPLFCHYMEVFLASSNIQDHQVAGKGTYA
jgi:hypothetical protein